MNRFGGCAGERPLSAQLEQSILDFIRHLYSAIGWPGVVLLMAAESAGIPVPSEIIMPFAGWFLVQDKGHGFGYVLLAGLLGAIGNTLGSIIAYFVGDYGGRPLLERYGRYVLITRHDLDRAQHFFEVRGALAVFVSRLLPVVRTYISFPAGIARMRFGLFVALTFAGSFLWSVALAWAGYVLGKDWEKIRSAMRPFDYPIAVVIVLAIAWFVWSHVKRGRQQARAAAGADSPPRSGPSR